MKRILIAALFLAAALTAGSWSTSGQVPADTGEARLGVEIGKTLYDYFAAYSHYDVDGTIAAVADDGFAYSTSGGYVSNLAYKRELQASLRSPAPRAKETFVIEGLKIYSPGADIAIANFTVNWTSELNGATFHSSDRTTNVLVRRGGRWQIVADHTSKLPTPVEPVLPGMPVGWRRAPANSSNGYAMTIDTAIRHSGKASASIRFGCAESDSFGSLEQFISAGEYRGRRVRLSGWLSTKDADAAGLWLRVDGDHRTLGFDNMMSRAVRGTTAWKRYEVVLDVPADAINIYLGALLYQRGQVWLDDLKLELVGNGVAVTNQLSPEETQLEKSRTPPGPGLAQPVNLGFENGAVP